jgi:hypothetical protein
MAVGNQAGQYVYQEVRRTSTTRVLDVRGVLELLIDRFNDGPLSEKQFI